MEVDINTLTPEQCKNIMQSRWVLRDGGNQVRARIVAKGFIETVADLDDIYASTPIFCVLRTLLTLACDNGWVGLTGAVFQPAAASACTTKRVLQPGGQHCMEAAENNLRTTQQPTGMAETPGRSPSTDRTSPQHSRTQHLHDGTTQLLFVLAYVEDILCLGEEQIVNKLFKKIQQHLLLRPTGTMSPGNAAAFLGRNIISRGNHYEISLSDD